MAAPSRNEVATVLTMSAVVDGRRMTIREWYHAPDADEVGRALALASSLGAARVRISRHNLPVPF